MISQGVVARSFRAAVLSETAGAKGFGLPLNVLHRRVETDLSPSVWRARDRFEPRNIRGGGAASEGRAVERRPARIGMDGRSQPGGSDQRAANRKELG